MTTTAISGASYGDCVAALRSSLSQLESSVSTLGRGVADLPRIASVLRTVRHFELVPQPRLAAAEASLRDEIGPAIAALLGRADAQADRAGRRIDALKARAELQRGRLVQTAGDDGDDAASYREKAGGYQGGKKEEEGEGEKGKRRRLGGEAKLRARVVRQRKAALRYGVERLELEVLQKERELRKRLEKA